jgi:magnesium chelatase subunit I
MRLNVEITNIKNLGELRRSGYQVRSVKEELRQNLLTAIKKQDNIFSGIIGYDSTVIPELYNAILCRHDFILLGLRGQAKTRILRNLTGLLDPFIPILAGSELNDNPYQPISYYGKNLIKQYGDESPVEWISRENRYNEKLATPDVSIADLIGDIDPIKAATQRLEYSHEGVIHYGIIPRTNRGIFVINELPDLQPRIQVGLLNILEERDLQIRGYPIRIPLDILIAFSANPEDYTNRGNIITPLKDRIDSQIITHYPLALEDGIRITQQEAWQDRAEIKQIRIPYFFREIVESIAREARSNELIDQKSGVSARLPISCLELLIGNAERRSNFYQLPSRSLRIADFQALPAGITGKIELVYEGEQEGVTKVAKILIGQAIKSAFEKYFPVIKETDKNKKGKSSPDLDEIISWFNKGQLIRVDGGGTDDEYIASLQPLVPLQKLIKKYFPKDMIKNDLDLAVVKEFVLEGLYQSSYLSKLTADGKVTYKDLMDSILDSWPDEEEDKNLDNIA